MPGTEGARRWAMVGSVAASAWRPWAQSAGFTCTGSALPRSYVREAAQPPHGSGGSFFTQGNTFEQIRPNRDVTGQLRTLRQYYTVFESDRRVIEVLEEQAALFTLLIQAVGPLQMAFGEKRLLQVRVQYSDDDRFLKVAVQLPADFGSDPEGALRSFDREWWLQNCHRSGGMLVFDYEIQDAV